MWKVVRRAYGSKSITLPWLISLLLVAVLMGATTTVRAHDITLQNDGYSSGQNAVFQGGFVSGEIGAVRLSPPGPFPMQIKQVLFLFGGATGQIQILLRIYDDSDGTLNPGNELFSNTYLVTASNTAMQSIDLTTENLIINGDIRVGIEMVDGGFPSIARDDDGGITSGVNFIWSTPSWVTAETFGVTGDWIIRAVVTDELVPTYPMTWGRLKARHRP